MSTVLRNHKRPSPFTNYTSSSAGKCYIIEATATECNESFYTISNLKKYRLKADRLKNGFVFELSYEDGEFLLFSDFLNLYSNGTTLEEAHELMVEKIEDFYEDLNSDDRYSPRFLRIKDYLNSVIEC